MTHQLDSRGRLIESLRKIIEPARQLTKKHFPKACALGDNWAQECPGAMMAILPPGQEKAGFVTLVDLPGNPEDWTGYLKGKLIAVQHDDIDTSMSVRNPDATPPVYGGGFSEDLLKRGYEPGTIDRTIGSGALTGGFESWDSLTFGIGVIKTFGQSVPLMAALSWDAPGVAACGVGEGLDRSGHQALTRDMMGLMAL